MNPFPDRRCGAVPCPDDERTENDRRGDIAGLPRCLRDPALSRAHPLAHRPAPLPGHPTRGRRPLRARGAVARPGAALARRRGGRPMKRRNILFITTDQQRYDSLGCTGNRVARTPHVDVLAKAGLLYARAHVHNVVCMPSRSTMLTGQHPRTHGVIANGIPLPEDAPSVAQPPPPARRLPHRAVRQSPLRAASRSVPALPREPLRVGGLDRPLARLRAHRARHPRPDGRSPLRGAGSGASTPRTSAASPAS